MACAQAVTAVPAANASAARTAKTHLGSGGQQTGHRRTREQKGRADGVRSAASWAGEGKRNKRAALGTV